MSARRAIFASMLLALAASVVRADPAPPAEFKAFGPRIFERAPGALQETVISFAVVNPTIPYRMRIRNGGVLDPSGVSVFSAEILLNGAPVVTFSEFNKKVQLAEKPVILAATNVLSVSLRGRPRSVIEIEIVGDDADLPEITADYSPMPNAAGWHNGEVLVTFECTDETSKIVSCPLPEVVATEGIGIVVTGVAIDAAGHSASTSVTFNVDRTPPAISIGQPADGVTVHDASLDILGSAFDANDVVSVTCNGAPATLAGEPFTCHASLAEGPNTITAEAVDTAGNAAVASIAVTRHSDFTAPVLTITSPTPQSLFSTTTVNVTGHVDDSSATVAVNGRPATLTPSGQGADFTVTDIPLEEGSNILTATARDLVDNAATASLQVVRDTVPPTVTVDYPLNGSTTGEATIVVTGMINEMVVGTFNDEQGDVTVNGVSAVVSNRTYAAPGIPLTPGPNTITVIGSDLAGNLATVAVTVTRATPSGRHIEIVSGNAQSSVVGAALAAPLVVLVKDDANQPVAGANVIFRVVENDGTLADGATSGKRRLLVPTGPDGKAQVAWTLGSRAGASCNRAEAYAVGYEGTVVFTAGAQSGPATRIFVDAGNGQIAATGQRLPHPLVAVVTDGASNRIEGVPVTFSVASGGASFDGQPNVVVATDSDGRAAAVPTLGTFEGIDTTRVEATFPGNAGPPITFLVSSLDAGDAAETAIVGVVVDNTNQPVPGVTLKVQGTVQQTTADAQGQFRLATVPVGKVVLIVDGSTATRPGTWPMLMFDLVTVAGRDNTVGMPIYILPLDIANGVLIDETHGGTVTLADIPGFALEVAPGSATFADGSRSGRVHVTAVHVDKVPMLPGFGSQPRLTVTIQPVGVHFDPPARMTVPNLEGLAPGAITDMYSFDHDLAQFVGIGTGTVSEDGTVVRSDPGVGVVKGGWHYSGPPIPDGDLGPCSPNTAASRSRRGSDEAGHTDRRAKTDMCCVCGPCASCDSPGQCVPFSVGDIAALANGQTNDSGHTIYTDTTTPVQLTVETLNARCGSLEYRWSVGELDRTANGPNPTYTYTTPGPHTATVTLVCGGCVTATATVVVTVLEARVQSTDVTQNKIEVVLSPSGLTGELKLELVGPTPHTIRTATRPSGTHLENFDIPNLPRGEFTSVKATWTTQGFEAEGQRNYHIKVHGNAQGNVRNSVYNTPYESTCDPAPMVDVYFTNNQCVFTPGQLNATFRAQVDLNGSGYRTLGGANVEAIQVDAFCPFWRPPPNAPPGTPPAPPADAEDNSYRIVTTFTPACPGTIDPTTVASHCARTGSKNCSVQGPIGCGGRVFLPALNATKTVTDNCPDCRPAPPGLYVDHLDNYTTQQSCEPDAFNDIATSKAIELISP